MLDSLSQRLLTVLQLSRMALVFTAVSNSACTLLLSLRRSHGPEADILAALDWRLLAAIAMISVGLYGFGMSLNDIIDRHRDRQIAAHRPIPSGRMGLAAAHLVCGLLVLLALAGGIIYASLAPSGWRSLMLLMWTAFLIVTYDFAGKYLIGIGVVTLGLIRFFHALIPAPSVPLLWHPLLMFTHVAILSAVAYVWEEKRPTLTKIHAWIAYGGVAVIDLVLIALVWDRTRGGWTAGALWVRPGLLLPAAMVGLFVVLAWLIRQRSASRRHAGQNLMLAGLLWLIVYDSAFVAVYVGVGYAAAVLALAPISYLMVHVMRWWNRVLLLSQQPTYKRAHSGPRQTV